MSKHKSEDYKIIAVKYYLENDTNYTKTCEIFKCSERSLKRWIKRYEELEEIKRLNRKQVSYKITKEQVKYAIQKLKENEQISMEELYKIIKKKYKDFEITSQHLGQVIRDNNITRKRTRHERQIKIFNFYLPYFLRISLDILKMNIIQKKDMENQQILKKN